MGCVCARVCVFVWVYASACVCVNAIVFWSGVRYKVRLNQWFEPKYTHSSSHRYSVRCLINGWTQLVYSLATVKNRDARAVPIFAVHIVRDYSAW